jgi:hypothetical protein
MKYCPEPLKSSVRIRLNKYRIVLFYKDKKRILKSFQYRKDFEKLRLDKKE